MKHVFVTGGARGIGKAIVEELAEHGYRITATYHESTKVAQDIKGRHQLVEYIRVDLQDREALDKLITDLQESDPIDVLINNAGVYTGKRFAKMTVEELHQQVDLNLTAPARLIHGLIPVLAKTQAPIVVDISSQAVEARYPGEAMYSAVKSALSTLAYVLRAELNPEGIRFVTIEPFGVNTYGIPEPSNLILPKDLAKVVRSAIETPEHIQLDTVRLSHIKQNRSVYPAWVENQ